MIRKDLDILSVLAGKKIEVPTISSKKIRVEIPMGFNLREPFRIPEEGMPKFGGSGSFGPIHGKRGDLYLEFDIKVPKVNADIKKLLNE